jgi:hypothetical protein
MRLFVPNLRGLPGAFLLFCADKNTLPSSSSSSVISISIPLPLRITGPGPRAKLLLCPGTLLIGLSSPNLNLAVALATPQAGVGLSSIGEDEAIDPTPISRLIRLNELFPCPGARNGDGRTGEIITKSSSCLAEGEGEGDNLCLPLFDGKGDLNAVVETAKGFEGDAKEVLLLLLLDLAI